MLVPPVPAETLGEDPLPPPPGPAVPALHPGILVPPPPPPAKTEHVGPIFP